MISKKRQIGVTTPSIISTGPKKLAQIYSNFVRLWLKPMWLIAGNWSWINTTKLLAAYIGKVSTYTYYSLHSGHATNKVVPEQSWKWLGINEVFRGFVCLIYDAEYRTRPSCKNIIIDASCFRHRSKCIQSDKNCLWSGGWSQNIMIVSTSNEPQEFYIQRQGCIAVITFSI